MLALLFVPGYLLLPPPSEEKVLMLTLPQQALKAQSSEWASGFLFLEGQGGSLLALCC